MFDTATHHLFEAAGWKKRDLLSEFDIVGYPMVDTRARFILPSTFGDDIVIETQVAAIRNSSFDVEHKVFKPAAEGERLAIEAWETRVWVGRHPHDPARLKSRPIPPWWRRGCWVQTRPSMAAREDEGATARGSRGRRSSPSRPLGV